MDFVGTYDKTIDKKGRVSIPAPFRNALGDQTKTIYIFPSIDSTRDCLIVWTEENMKNLIDKMRKNFKHLSEQEQMTMTLTINSSRQVTIDENGRIQIPTDFMHEFGLSESVVFVGDALYFGIWEPTCFGNYLRSMRQAARIKHGNNVLLGMLSEGGGAPGPDTGQIQGTEQ